MCIRSPGHDEKGTELSSSGNRSLRRSFWGSNLQYLSPIHLGNSFTEFNAGVAVKHVSCITCHSYARLSSQPSASTANPENTNFGAFPGRPQVGISTQPPAPAPQGWPMDSAGFLLVAGLHAVHQCE